MKKITLLLKIKYISVFFCLLFVSSKMYGQTPANNPVNCQTGITIQVFSSSATNIVIGNAAPFLFSPQAGQVTNYTLTKIGESTPFAQQTVLASQGGSNNTFNFQLPSSVTTADFIFVQMTVTATNGDVCYVEDILRWTPTGTPPFQFFFWNNVNPPGNFGTYSNILSTSDFESNSFSFYPNPAKDIVNFSSKNNIENITLYNVLSQEVLTKQVNSNEFTLNLSNLPSGTYIAKLKNNISKTVKLVKL
ncbi:T9SS type A sorting domain-containing protein [Flavobacterium sp.]|uniref:T9SS type A sorting domain-containing protein n=1 Tax=Flavobacterium sp. TaxID=239 RepID=UPI0026306C2A|nr:T9SS type A sorting domain-containing protein [Flavobacterium sp.]